MSRINVLDIQTANLIAAGEVVERPANAVKELIENSIDAGASSIVIEIKGGGIDLIRITDNGSGIDKDDMPLCIKRHATSKIKFSSDLDSISTLGFRGEALAAISATSKFLIMSKTKDSPFGYQIQIEGDKVSEVEECGCADGTTVIAKELFFNQPARRKFLKREMTESSAVLQYVQRIAVSHPEIAFKFISNNEIKLITSGDNKLDSCIYSVYGKEFSSSLFPIQHTYQNISIYGFATRPEFSRNTHAYQSFYINKRYVKSKTVQFAMEDAYRSFVKSEKFPGCVLFLDIDFGEVDVNVHPAKLEVRFGDERKIYNAVYSAIKQSIEKLSNQIARDEYIEAVKNSGINDHKNTLIPEIKEKQIYTPISEKAKIGTYSEVNKSELPLFANAEPIKSKLVPEEEIIKPKEVEIKGFSANIFKNEIKENNDSIFDRDPKKTVVKALEYNESEKLSKEESKKAFEESQIKLFDEKYSEDNIKNNPVMQSGAIRGVIFDAFIIYETKEAVYFIDKHAAHERIIYESIKNTYKRNNIQILLEPIIITLSHAEAIVISENIEEINNIGFSMEEFGDNMFIIRGIPLIFTEFDSAKITSLIEETAKELSIGGKAHIAKDKLFDRVLYSMSCKAAIKAGIPSETSDHEWIVEKLKEIDNIIVCPHGRPIIAKFTKKQVENLFLRD